MFEIYNLVEKSGVCLEKLLFERLFIVQKLMKFFKSFLKIRNPPRPHFEKILGLPLLTAIVHKYISYKRMPSPYKLTFI